MALTIKDSLKRLGTKLSVDMTKAPASNIADMIDYITENIGDNAGSHSGVVSTAIDHIPNTGWGSSSGDYDDGDTATYGHTI